LKKSLAAQTQYNLQRWRILINLSDKPIIILFAQATIRWLPTHYIF